MHLNLGLTLQDCASSPQQAALKDRAGSVFARAVVSSYLVVIFFLT